MVDVFGPGVSVPDVVTKPPAKVTGTSATLRGTIDGDGEPAEYHFELGESEAYAGLSTPVTQTKGGGKEKVAASVTGLQAATPATTCVWSLKTRTGRAAASGGGSPPPKPKKRSVGSRCPWRVSCRRRRSTASPRLQVGSSEATLQAQIDPHGHDTTVQFQYGTESCATNPGACTTTPSTPIDVGSGES